MYELTVILITFCTVALSCWWIDDGDEPDLIAYPTTMPRPLLQEQAGLGD